MWLTSQVPLGLPQGDGYEPSTRELGAINHDGTTPRSVASTRGRHETDAIDAGKRSFFAELRPISQSSRIGNGT